MPPPPHPLTHLCTTKNWATRHYVLPDVVLWKEPYNINYGVCLLETYNYASRLNYQFTGQTGDRGKVNWYHEEALKRNPEHGIGQMTWFLQQISSISIFTSFSKHGLPIIVTAFLLILSPLLCFVWDDYTSLNVLLQWPLAVGWIVFPKNVCPPGILGFAFIWK